MAEPNAPTNLEEEFNRALKEADADRFTSPEFRRKKLFLYTIRTLLAACLYFFFWNYQWVRWSLFFYVPLNLLGLFLIIGWPFFLRRKIKRTRSKIEEVEQLIIETEEADEKDGFID